jgi:pilus assembly protein CpaB
MNNLVRVLFLVVALVAASLVSYVVYQRTATQPAALKSGSSEDVIQIAVANRNLNRGAKITVQDVRMASYLEETLPQGSFTDLTALVDRIVVKPIQPTEPILESALAPTSLTKGGMAAVIPLKKRAMAVKVDDVIGIAGFLSTGHFVDVVVSLEKPGEKRTQVTKTVLENIRVLAVGTEAQETEDKTSKKVTVVTLEVELEEAEKLALAVNQGSIQLVLRGYQDEVELLTKEITVTSLLESYSTESSVPVKVAQVDATAPKPVYKPRVVRKKLVLEVMNGNKVERLTMDGN